MTSDFTSRIPQVTVGFGPITVAENGELSLQRVFVDQPDSLDQVILTAPADAAARFSKIDPEDAIATVSPDGLSVTVRDRGRATSHLQQSVRLTGVTQDGVTIALQGNSSMPALIDARTLIDSLPIFGEAEEITSVEVRGSAWVEEPYEMSLYVVYVTDNDVGGAHHVMVDWNMYGNRMGSAIDLRELLEENSELANIVFQNGAVDSEGTLFLPFFSEDDVDTLMVLCYRMSDYRSISIFGSETTRVTTASVIVPESGGPYVLMVSDSDTDKRIELYSRDGWVGDIPFDSGISFPPIACTGTYLSPDNASYRLLMGNGLLVARWLGPDTPPTITFLGGDPTHATELGTSFLYVFGDEPVGRVFDVADLYTMSGLIPVDDPAPLFPEAVEAARLQCGVPEDAVVSLYGLCQYRQRSVGASMLMQWPDDGGITHMIILVNETLQLEQVVFHEHVEAEAVAVDWSPRLYSSPNDMFFRTVDGRIGMVTARPTGFSSEVRLFVPPVGPVARVVGDEGFKMGSGVPKIDPEVDSDDIAAIVGGIIGGLVLLALIVLAYRRWGKKKKA